MMFLSRRKSRAMMRMAHMESHEMKTALKVAAAGFVAYQAMKFMVKEIMD